MTSSTHYCPISELSPYIAPRWTILARIVWKSQLRAYPSKRRASLFDTEAVEPATEEAKTEATTAAPEAAAAPSSATTEAATEAATAAPARISRIEHVFEAQLLDESGWEIGATFFGPHAEKFGVTLVQGKCYTFRGGIIRFSQPGYARCAHPFRIIFDRCTEIEEAADVPSIPVVRYCFWGIRQLLGRALTTVDLIGVVIQSKPPHMFFSRDGKELVKREITIVDDTFATIVISIWGPRAKLADEAFSGFPVVCFKGVTIRDWQGGLQGSLPEGGVMDLNSKIPEVDRILSWWSQTGAHSSSSFASVSLPQDPPIDLRTLSTKPLPATVALVGVVVNFEPLASFVTQEGSTRVKRAIVIADDTGFCLSVLLWEAKAESSDEAFANHPIVILRGVLVKEWNGGRSGSLIDGGSVVFEPKLTEADRVRRWFNGGGSATPLTSLSNGGASSSSQGGASKGRMEALTLAELRARCSSYEASGGDVIVVASRLAMVQTRKRDEVQPLLYSACQELRPRSTMPCSKRVSPDGFCAACDRFSKVAPRLHLRCKIMDFTGSAWLTTFHEAAQSLLGLTAKACARLEAEPNGREQLEAAIQKRYMLQPMEVVIKTRLEVFNGQSKISALCSHARPINRRVHGRQLLKNIEDMLKLGVENAAEPA